MDNVQGQRFRSPFYNKTLVNCLHNGINHTLNHYNGVVLQRVTLLVLSCYSIDNDMVNVPFVLTWYSI